MKAYLSPDFPLHLAQRWSCWRGRCTQSDDQRQNVGEQPAGHCDLGELLVWTAPDGIKRARLRSLLISDKGDRPWSRLAELGWIRRNTFSSITVGKLDRFDTVPRAES